jgi:uncharacterized protein (TIGR02270 family)
MDVISEIIEQHADVAAFSWYMRDAAVGEPHYSLSEVADLDDRIEANIDGLRIAADKGWEICKETLDWEEAGDVFTAAVLAFENGNADRIQAVVDAGGSSFEISRGIVSALGWIPFPQVESFILDFLHSESPLLCRIGLAAFAVHRRDPGQFMHTVLNSSEPILKARALKAFGELGKTDFAAAVIDHLNDDDENCRFYAAWSAALLGSTAGLPALQAIVKGAGPRAEKACSIALRRMSVPEGHDWGKAISSKKEMQRIQVIGVGAIGDPVLIPLLIEYMSIPETARVAGEAFAMITGVDIIDENLEGQLPEGFDAVPSENPEDEDVSMDPDENLPWPDPELVHDWWGEHKYVFRNGIRYLCGKPVSRQHCQHVLASGLQRQRAAAALEMALMHPGQPLFEVRAPGFQQVKALGLKK